jgi:hypothetical protein
MSDESDSGSRDRNGRFPKGVSGNPRGRPRKVERTFTHRQIRQDVLSLMEQPIDIKIQGKTNSMPIILGIYWKMFQRALEGDARMMLAVAQLRHDLVHELTEQHRDEIAVLDRAEHDYATVGNRGFDKNAVDFLNEFRRRTRKY